MNKRFIIPFFTGILAMIAIVASKLVEEGTGDKVPQIAWFASFLVMITTLITNNYSIDKDKFIEVINKSNPTEHKLHPEKYLKWLGIAMVIGLLATIVIHYNFILGMIVYLFMQIALITAFSGIIVINPRVTFNDPALRINSIISSIFWLFYISMVYMVFVYSGAESLVVIPYIIFLGIMANITWYGTSYNRTTVFNYLLILASAVFVFSDSLIGNNVFGINKVNANLFKTIDITYVFNIYLMSQAVLFLKDNENNSILINN